MPSLLAVEKQVVGGIWLQGIICCPLPMLMNWHDNFLKRGRVWWSLVFSTF